MLIELDFHGNPAVEHYAKDSPGQRHLFDESKIERDSDGKFAEKGSSEGPAPADTKDRSGIDKSDSPSALAEKESERILQDSQEPATLGERSKSGEPANAAGSKATPRAKTMTITRSSGTRNVDAYRVGGLYKHDGQWHVITGYQRSADDHGGYEHTLQLRPATADEAKQGRLQDISRELSAMSAGPDDDRGRASHDARVRALQNEQRTIEGRPSVEDERAERADTAARVAADRERMKTATREEKDAHYREHAAPIAAELAKHITGDGADRIIAGLMEAVRDDWDGTSDPTGVTSWVMVHARDGNADGELRFDQAEYPETAAYLSERRKPEEDAMLVVRGNTYQHKDRIKQIPGARFRDGKWSIPAQHVGRLPRGLSAT